MRYGYTDDDILKNIKLLEEMMNKSKNKAFYKKIIDDLKTSINENYLSNVTITQTLNSTMFDIFDNYYKNGRYYDFIKVFEYEMAKQFNTSKLNEIAENYLDKENYYTHDEAFSIVHDFYKKLDKELFDTFLLIYNDRYKTVRFRRDVESVNGMESDGYCIFVDKLLKNYITIHNEVGFNKLLSLTHECGHGIFNILNPKSYTFRVDDYSTEIATMFLEQVFNYEVINNINPFQAAYININKLNDFGICSYYLGCHADMIDAWKKSNNKVDKYYYRNVKDKLNLTREQAKEALCVSILDDGIYTIDYIVSLELFNLYKKDKEKALYILKQIESALPHDTLLLLEKYLPKYIHLGEEIDCINDNMCKQLLKKGIC